MKEFLKKELAGWNPIEAIWLIAATGIITCLSAYWRETWYGFVSAITGVICVVLTGKGKVSAYAFGTVNCVFYGYISYTQALYGETMLNLLWYLPLQFYGFFMWRKNLSDGEVIRRTMGWLDRIDKAVLIAICTACYGMALTLMGDPLPYVDSFTTVASVFAMWLSCKRYAEQWYLWIAVDVLSVCMWWNRYCAGGDNISTLAMWAVFLVNAVYGCIKWEANARRRLA